jgi:small-conductance mechanosensitive channel
MRHWAVRSLLIVAGVLALVIAWRLISPLSVPRLEEALGTEASEIWNKPFFTAGTLAVTPSFLIKILVYFVVLVVLTRVVRRLVRRALEPTTLDPGLKFAIDKVVGYSFFFIGGMIALQSAGLDLSTITVLGGALGIGIGFGLQNIAKNFASGMVLLIERPINIGDRVQVGDLLGDIVKIGSRSTQVRTNENVLIIVPNSEFVEQRVTNLTGDDPRIRVSVSVGVSYSSDPLNVERILGEVSASHPDVLLDPAPQVIFTGFGESSLDFELWAWTATKMNQPKVLRSQIYFKIFDAFREHGIEIPFPQRDLHFRSSDLETSPLVSPPVETAAGPSTDPSASTGSGSAD